MPIERATRFGWRFPLVGSYLGALGFAGLAILCRAALQPVAPGIGPYVLLLPAVVLASMVWGTGPASVAAVAGGLVTWALLMRSALVASPFISAAQINLVLYVPACAAVIWVTHALRRLAASAELAEARLAEVFRQIPGAAAIVQAPDGRLLLSSRRSNLILGHAPFGSLSDYGGLHLDGRPIAHDDYPIMRALHTGEVVGGEHIRYRRPDGGVIDLEVHAGPVRGADDRILAAVGMAFDITERMAAEQRLRDSEAAFRTVAERLRAAIDAGGLGLWEIDIARGRMHIDATMAAMLGMAPRPVELPSADMRVFVHPADLAAVRATMDAAVLSGGAYAEECRMVTAQGQVRWVVSRGAVLGDLRKVIGVVSDVTERRAREDALRQALAAREVLMHEADHRIKNSLQMVTSLLRLQLSRAGDVVTRQALGDAIARVDAIANAHLALERSPDLRTIQVDHMLADLCGRVGALNPAVAIRCEASAGIALDAEQAIPLGLIASEVLTNALRHGFPPGVPGWVSLEIAARDGGLDMVIADGGVGLPAAPRRTGLGSSVIAVLARQIGAEITTDSKPGEGVVVTMRLCLAGGVSSRAVPEPSQLRPSG